MAAPQLSMKNMRELKLRLEGNLHTKYKAAARHGIPVTGTAGCINNVGTLGIHFVKQVIDLSVDIDILRRCIACTHIEDSIIICRPAVRVIRIYTTEEVVAVQSCFNLSIIIVYGEGSQILRGITIAIGILIFVLVQMSPADVSIPVLTQLCHELCVPATRHAFGVDIACSGKTNTAFGFGFKPVEGKDIIVIKALAVADGRSTAVSRLQGCVTVLSVSQLIHAGQNKEITATCIKNILIGNIPAQLVALGGMAFQGCTCLTAVAGAVIAQAAGQGYMRNDFPVILHIIRSVLHLEVCRLTACANQRFSSVVLAVSIIHAENYIMSVGEICYLITDKVIGIIGIGIEQSVIILRILTFGVATAIGKAVAPLIR